MPRRRGFTLIEIMMAVLLFAILSISSAYLLRTILVSWSGQEMRSGLQINLDRGMEDMERDLRKATQVQSTANYDEIRYAQRQGASSTYNYYIFYLYHAADSYVPPPSFSQSSYQLRRATLSGGINGTFTYGSGDVVLNDVIPPPTSDLSLSGNLMVLDLTVKRGDETLHSRTQVRPRNV